MAVCNYLLDGWLCGTRTPDGADKCTSHGGLSMLDRLIPHAVFHLGIWWEDAAGTHSGYQILNVDRESVFNAMFLNRKLDDSYPIHCIKALEPHRGYFIDLIERRYLTAHESDKARAILKTARTSSAVEGITKPFDGDAMAEIVAKAYPPAIFPGDATS